MVHFLQSYKFACAPQLLLHQGWNQFRQSVAKAITIAWGWHHFEVGRKRGGRKGEMGAAESFWNPCKLVLSVKQDMSAWHESRISCISVLMQYSCQMPLLAELSSIN